MLAHEREGNMIQSQFNFSVPSLSLLLLTFSLFNLLFPCQMKPKFKSCGGGVMTFTVLKEGKSGSPDASDPVGGET